MSSPPLPRKVRLIFDLIQRNFLWGGGSLDQKSHLINWPTVRMKKNVGGLGVKNLSSLNKTLLCGWSWRYANEKGALWVEVIKGKYGEEGRIRALASLGKVMGWVNGEL